MQQQQKSIIFEGINFFLSKSIKKTLSLIKIEYFFF